MTDWDANRDDCPAELYAGGVRFHLPPRRLGKARYVGWGMIGFGAFGVVFMIFWMSGPIRSGLELLGRGQGFGWAFIVFGCLGIFGLVPALAALWAGLAVLMDQTRCTVEIRDGWLVTTERLLAIPWRRKHQVVNVTRLRVASADTGISHAEKHELIQWLGRSAHALLAEGSEGKPFPVVLAYPRELLLKLGDDLARRLESETMVSFTSTPLIGAGSSGDDHPRTGIPVVEGDIDVPAAREPFTIPEPPPNTRVTIERRSDGMTLHVPPAGLIKGSKGLLVFSLFWNTLVSIFLVMGILAVLGKVKVEGNAAWFPLVFMIPFALIGVVILLVAINMGRRYASLATADDLVFLVTHSLFGKRQQEWAAEDLDRITCGPTGMTVNDTPVMELQFYNRDGRKYGCLSQLTEAELVWIAAELQQWLEGARA